MTPANDESRAREARTIVRAALTATLATLGRGGPAAAGAPYASLVLVATLADARPVLLLSDLAEHTKNLAADARVSLLFDATQGLESPLTGARLTLQGTIARTGEAEARRRFLARHPDAAGYAGFADFGFYLVEPRSAHLVAGFGAIHWLDWAQIALATQGCDEAIAAEPGILAHMNEDHGQAIDDMAAAAGGPGAGWTMTGCDPEGCDLRRGGRALRLSFPDRASSTAAVRAHLVAMTRKARGRAIPK